MEYVQTFENFIFSGSLNEATEVSLKNTQDRIKQLTDIGTRLKNTDYTKIIANKKDSVESAKNSKDTLRLQMSQRNLKMAELKSQKKDLRLKMISTELNFLKEKLAYQQQVVNISKEIQKLKQ